MPSIEHDTTNDGSSDMIGSIEADAGSFEIEESEVHMNDSTTPTAFSLRPFHLKSLHCSPPQKL